MMQQRYKKQIQKVVKKKLPKINGRVGALPPLDTQDGNDDDRELSSKRARSLQEKPVNALSPGPDRQEVNLTKVTATDPNSPQNDTPIKVDNSTVVTQAK